VHVPAKPLHLEVAGTHHGFDGGDEKQRVGGHARASERRLAVSCDERGCVSDPAARRYALAE